MKVLLTGASGYIGTEILLQLLMKGIHVTAVTRNPDAIPAHPLIEIVGADLMCENSIDKTLWGCDYVIHAAGLAKAWDRNKRRYFEENCHMTSIILNASFNSRIQKFILISSAGVLKSADGNGSAERDVLTNITTNAYIDSKLFTEHIALHYLSAGMPILILRPARVYGPGKLTQSNQVTQTIINYVNGKPMAIPGSGDHTGSYCLVQDVAKGIANALTNSGLTGVFNLGGTNASFNELFGTIGNEWGRARKLPHIPVPVLKTAGLLNQLSGWITNGAPLLTLNQVKKLTSHHSVDSNKAEQQLGYHFTPLTIGIRETILWATQQGLVNNTPPYSIIL